jgi:type IV secretion system protein VirB1
VTDAHAPPQQDNEALEAKVDATLNEAGGKRDTRPAVESVAAMKSKAPSCSAHPLVAMCRGLSAAQVRALCLRCLDAH